MWLEKQLSRTRMTWWVMLGHSPRPEKAETQTWELRHLKTHATRELDPSDVVGNYRIPCMLFWLRYCRESYHFATASCQQAQNPIDIGNHPEWCKGVFSIWMQCKQLYPDDKNFKAPHFSPSLTLWGTLHINGTILYSGLSSMFPLIILGEAADLENRLYSGQRGWIPLFWYSRHQVMTHEWYLLSWVNFISNGCSQTELQNSWQPFFMQ